MRSFILIANAAATAMARPADPRIFHVLGDIRTSIYTKKTVKFARAADVYHEERFAPSDEITGRFGKIVRAEELWCLRNLYTRLRARPFVALKPAPKAQGGKK